MKWWKKRMRDITKPEVSKKLKKWQDKYDTAKTEYQDVIEDIKRYSSLYEGDRRVNRNPNKGGGTAKELATNVRNITFDLTESEVDSAIPYPKVQAIHKEDEEAAKAIEAFLKYEMIALHLLAKNDIKERTTPITGGSFDVVEWDNTKRTHCTIGNLSVKDVSPEDVIPQPGVTKLEEMDYVFIRTKQTKDYIKRRWNVDVSEEKTTEPGEKNYDEIVDLITVYYRNDDDGIGMFRWCGDVEVEDLEDYEARYIKKCRECGETVTGDVCPKCGSKKFETVTDENDHVIVPVYQVSVDENGNETVLTDENGEPLYDLKEVELPYYKTKMLPVVSRVNISKAKSFLGFSDAAAIEDQQDTVKKLGSKTNEKTLKAGSFLTLPEGVDVETTDKEFKIVRVKNPAELAMISVLTCQADISKDLTLLETNYQWAKSALGITDAYQGKYDSSATSGAAKQYSINQAAGRLESKRVMKNEAYANLYELMFKFALSYADQPIPITIAGPNGETEYGHFDKSMFVKFDDAGDPYWNDEFLFTIDPTSTLLTNREALWNQSDLKLQSGAYGPLGALTTMRLYWLELARNGYPHAGEILAEVERMLAEQNEQQALMLQEGVPNDMPQM